MLLKVKEESEMNIENQDENIWSELVLDLWKEHLPHLWEELYGEELLLTSVDVRTNHYGFHVTDDHGEEEEEEGSVTAQQLLLNFNPSSSDPDEDLKLEESSSRHVLITSKFRFSYIVMIRILLSIVSVAVHYY